MSFDPSKVTDGTFTEKRFRASAPTLLLDLVRDHKPHALPMTATDLDSCLSDLRRSALKLGCGLRLQITHSAGKESISLRHVKEFVEAHPKTTVLVTFAGRDKAPRKKNESQTKNAA